jgi:hypothetical protein
MKTAESGRADVSTDRMRIICPQSLGLEMKHWTAARLVRFDFKVDYRSVLTNTVRSADRCLIGDKVAVRPPGQNSSSLGGLDFFLESLGDVILLGFGMSFVPDSVVGGCDELMAMPPESDNVFAAIVIT